ncbi:MAG: DUF3021 family protein [Lachnospiraceae bacterium]
MNGFKRYLSSEIGIEFKACLYFYTILFFYSLYCIIQGSFFASIIWMAEMIFTAYVMGYIQVYLLNNFDESEHLGKREVLYSFLCSALYAAVSYLLRWFDRNVTVTAIYFFYMLFCYICVFFVYKIKRDIDTAQLNKELEQFKNKKG